MAQTVKKLPAVQETGVWPLGWEDPLEEGMATLSRILARRTSWTKEPGRLQSMGSQQQHFKNYFYFWPRCVACGTLVPWPGMKPMPPALAVWSLNHWIARKVTWFYEIVWPKHIEWNRKKTLRGPSHAIFVTKYVLYVALTGTWHLVGSYIDAVRAWHQNFLSGQSRCPLPSEKRNKPHIKSIQHASSYRGSLYPFHIPWVTCSSVPSASLLFFTRWPSVSISTRYYLYKHFRSARWEIHTVFCPDPHVSLRKAVFITYQLQKMNMI